MAGIEVKIGDGSTLNFSPGGHNLLQKAIIEDFLPIYGHGAEVLYVGDASNKSLFLNAERLAALKFFELSHDKLPHVVAYSADKNWLFSIEAITTAHPISELRRRTRLELSEGCKAAPIFVTAFPNRTVFRKFSADIALEATVGLADSLHHMIHLNGDKSMGPYPSTTQAASGKVGDKGGLLLNV
jgi:type II restriction enzyme